MISEACLDFYKKWRQNLDFERSGTRVFLEDPKKYTFGKSNFKTFFKSRKSEILPPFLSTSNTWMVLVLLKMVSGYGGHVFVVFHSDPSGPRSMYTTNKTISILICSKMIDSLLCKFSRNVLQKYRLRENT